MNAEYKNKKEVNNVVFLESNIKKATIKTFLGSDYEIFATGGHISSLENSGYCNIGVDLDNFSPKYEIIKTKENLVKFWKDYLEKNPKINIFIATDPDREGARIAQELVDILDLKDNYERLFFHEITFNAIKEALENPTKLDFNLIDAQVSREVLDKMIGFCLSSLIQKKINAWSAGRVQSVVLKLIVDREREIMNHVPKVEFLVIASFKIGRKKHKLVEKEGIVNSLKIYNSYDEANKTLENLNSVFKLIHVDESIKYIFPKQPFTTSLLLYESKVNFGFSIQKTTSIIQKLYEGVQLNIENKKKRISLITYPRTDSSRINKSFSFQIFSLISEKWGKELFKLPKINPSKRRNVQDAHEAIRPTYLKYKPDELKNYDLEEDFIKVYEMIYNNTITAFMRPIKYCDKIYYYSNDKRYFGIEEKVLIEKGFLTLGYGNFSKYGLVDNSQFENFTNIEINKDSLNVEKNEDDAPKRYSEGSLIKKLEVLGIGRPSTYNTFTRIILKRRYSLLDKKSTFIPTEMGFKVNDWLQENFSSIINENYTAFLEEQLDEISNGKNTYLNFINGFWKDFSERYKLAGGE